MDSRIGDIKCLIDLLGGDSPECKARKEVKRKTTVRAR